MRARRHIEMLPIHPREKQDVGFDFVVVSNHAIFVFGPWVALFPLAVTKDPDIGGVIGRAQDVVEVVPQLEVVTPKSSRVAIEEDRLHAALAKVVESVT